MLKAIGLLVDLFLISSTDRETLSKLRHMLDHEEEWIQAHDLFDRIRRKTLMARRADDQDAECQYCFEEICAKSLYNLSERDYPFDEDSPYWIVPNALSLGRARGLPDKLIIDIIMA